MGRLKDEWMKAFRNPAWWALVVITACLYAYLWSLP